MTWHGNGGSEDYSKRNYYRLRHLVVAAVKMQMLLMNENDEASLAAKAAATEQRKLFTVR